MAVRLADPAGGRDIMTVRTGSARLAAATVAAVALAAVLAAPAGVARGGVSVPADGPDGQPVSISLSGVSCPRGPGCLAVGRELTASSLGRDFAQASRGRAWRLLAPPGPGVPAGLSGVACARPDRCIAVGSYASRAGPGPGPGLERQKVAGAGPGRAGWQ